MSAGVRRGLVGQTPRGSRTAATLAECQRGLGVDVRVFLLWRRRDARTNFRRVLRALMRHADWETLRSRPGHALIAAEAGVSERTVCTMIDAAHQLGYLATLELGTTAQIREGRTRGQDPHRGQGNRAQEYRLCVPEAVMPPVYDDGQAPEVSGNVAGQTHNRRTFYPSRSGRSPELGTTPASRRSREPAGNARARVQSCARGRPSAGKKIIRSHTRRPVWLPRAREVTAVWQLLPTALTGRLADHEADRLAAEIARQLEHRSVAELGERIARHWDYWRYKLAADLVRAPIAIAFRLVRRDFDGCPDVRCEDRWHLDLDAPCKACAHIARAVTGGPADDSLDRAPYDLQRHAEGRTRPAGHPAPSGIDRAPVPPPLAAVVTARPAARHQAAAGHGASLARRLLRARTDAEREAILAADGDGDSATA